MNYRLSRVHVLNMNDLNTYVRFAVCLRITPRRASARWWEYSRLFINNMLCHSSLGTL